MHNDYYEMVCRMVNKWIKTGFLPEEERQRLLIGLNCMRMVSDSTYILDTGTNFGNKTGELKEFLSELTENPAMLEQRIGRIYRLGQKKQINVFNFITKGSIEHRILLLAGL